MIWQFKALSADFPKECWQKKLFKPHRKQGKRRNEREKEEKLIKFVLVVVLLCVLITSI